MKTTNIVLTILLVSTLLTATFASAISTGDVLGNGVAVSDAVSATASISSTDATETEVEIENEIKSDSSSKNTVSKGQGWIVAGQKGSLLEILFVSREGINVDGDVASVSKGWLKAGDLKLKIDSTTSTTDSKTFSVTGKDGSVSGTLILTKTAQVYQTGFAVWNGNLDIKVGDTPFDAKITLAIEEKQARKGPNPNSGRGNSGAVGTLLLGGVTYNLAGDSNKPQKLELKISSSSGTVGELKLESRDSKTYTGKIKIEGESDASKIEGKISATLSRERNTLYGPIKIELDGSASTDMAYLEGTIKILLSEKASDDSRTINNDVLNDDDSDDSLNKKGVESDKGFWKKFRAFFR